MDAKTTPPDISTLTPQERHRKILVREAAKLAGLSEGAFRKHFGHLIRKYSERCHRVEFQDAVTLPPAAPANNQTEAPRRGRHQQHSAASRKSALGG
jgi:hypothetical protein